MRFIFNPPYRPCGTGDRQTAVSVRSSIYGRSMSALSKSQQSNAVSEGFALGLCLLGYESLQFKGYNMVDVDLSLARAWRNWSYRTSFPAVDREFGPGGRNRHLIVTHAGSQRHTNVFYWDRYAWQTRGEWDFPEEAGQAAKMICEAVPAEAWKDLVEAFLDRLYAFGPGPAEA